MGKDENKEDQQLGDEQARGGSRSLNTKRIGVFLFFFVSTSYNNAKSR